MTHIEQAIRDAVEKGGMWNEHRSDTSFDKVVRNSIEDPYKLFLTPTFWQALGKARVQDWGEVTFFGNDTTAPTWLMKWHLFIDHLAEGKDAESFFAEITSTPN